MADKALALSGMTVLARQLAMQVNPQPYVLHKLRVKKYLRMENDFAVEGVTTAEWSAMLDHWDNDNSVGLGRHVFYSVGDIVEINRNEAAEIFAIVPSYFEPVDDLSLKLQAAVAKGSVE